MGIYEGLIKQVREYDTYDLVKWTNLIYGGKFNNNLKQTEVDFLKAFLDKQKKIIVWKKKL